MLLLVFYGPRGLQEQRSLSDPARKREMPNPRLPPSPASQPWGLQGESKASSCCFKSWAGANMASSGFRAQGYRKRGPNQQLQIQKSLILEGHSGPSVTLVTCKDLTFLFMLLKGGHWRCWLQSPLLGFLSHLPGSGYYVWSGKCCSPRPLLMLTQKIFLNR